MDVFPEFNASGDLPSGVHRGPLSAVMERFGSENEQRKLVSTRLERIYRLAATTGFLYRFVVFGSFITGKAAPNDVDIFLVMADGFDVDRLGGEQRYVFDHMSAHNLLGASVFWIPRVGCLGGEDATVLDWGIKRDGAVRGVVEIIAL